MTMAAPLIQDDEVKTHFVRVCVMTPGPWPHLTTAIPVPAPDSRATTFHTESLAGPQMITLIQPDNLLLQFIFIRVHFGHALLVTANVIVNLLV